MHTKLYFLNLATSHKKTTKQSGNDVAAFHTFVLKAEVTLGEIEMTIELKKCTEVTFERTEVTFSV